MVENIYLGRDIMLLDNDIQFSSAQDFAIVDSNTNLRQAIYDRLKTILGEYYVTDYGSQLTNTLGKPRNDLLKNQIIGYVGETLLQEVRIREVTDLIVEFPTEVDRINIDITIIPIDSDVPLNLVFPFFV